MTARGDRPPPNFTQDERIYLARRLAARDEPEADDPGEATRLKKREAAYLAEWEEQLGPAVGQFDHPDWRPPADMTPEGRLDFAREWFAAERSDLSVKERDRWFADHGRDDPPTPADLAVIVARIDDQAGVLALLAKWAAPAGSASGSKAKRPAAGRTVTASGKPRPSRARPERKPEKKTDPRVTGGWRKVPMAITRSHTLSKRARAVAVAICEATNFGPWNKDLHVDLTHADLGQRANVGGRRTVMRAVAELTEAKLFETEDRNRGGLRYRCLVW